MNTFIARNGQQIGNWPEDQVREFYRAGTLLPTDVYWQEGMTEWKPISALPDLVAETPAAVPPPTAAPSFAPVAPTPPRAEVAEPPPSRLTWFVPFLVAVAAAALTSSRPHHAGDEEVAFIGRVMGGFLFFYVIAFVISLIFPRRWRLGIRCGIILILAGLVALGVRRDADKKVADEMMNYGNTELAKARERLAHPDSNAPPLDPSVEINKLKALSQDQSPSMRAATDTSVELMQEINGHSKACRESEQQLLGLGLEPSKFTSLEELQKRCDAAAACAPPIQSFLDYLANLDKELRTKLASRGLTDHQIDQFMQGVHSGSRFEDLAAYWRIEQKCIADISSTTDLLKTQWGKWRLTDQKKIAFDDPSQAAAYNALARKIQANAIDEKAAQDKVLAAPAK